MNENLGEIALRVTPGPKILLAVQRVICPSEMSNPLAVPRQCILCRLQDGTVLGIAKHR